MPTHEILTNTFYRKFATLAWKYALRSDIMEALFRIMEDAFAQRRRHLYVRFDVSLPDNYPPCCPEVLFRRFINSFVANRTAKGHDPRYLWCREMTEGKRFPHWHLLFTFSARETISFMNHLDQAVVSWASVLGIPDAKGLVDFCLKDRYGNPQRNGILLQRGAPGFAGELRTTVQWGSYLAKEETKFFAPDKAHRWGASRSRSRGPVAPLEWLLYEPTGG
jgi:hypothetical protein